MRKLTLPFSVLLAFILQTSIPALAHKANNDFPYIKISSIDAVKIETTITKYMKKQDYKLFKVDKNKLFYSNFMEIKNGNNIGSIPMVILFTLTQSGNECIITGYFYLVQSLENGKSKLNLLPPNNGLYFEIKNRLNDISKMF